MAYDIGPKIGIEGEAEFRKSIQDIVTAQKTLKTEMQAVASQFDKNDTSQEKYRAVNEVLNKQIDTQKQKLDALSQGLSAATEKYGENDKVTQGWQQAVNKATADLNGMERELKENNSALNSTDDATDKAKAGIKDLGDESGASGKKVSSFGDMLKASFLGNALSDGIQKIVGGIKNLASSALESADSIQQMADQTGMSAEQIQKWKYTGDALGVSIDTITGSQMKLTKNMQSAANGSKTQSDAFKTLGVSVTDSNGHLRDAQTVMMEAFGALGKVGNETDRNALAMNIFGKSAADLNPMISAGTNELASLSQQASDTGAVMSGDTVGALDNFGDTMDQVKASAMSMVGEGLKQLLPTFQTIADDVKNFDFTPVKNVIQFVVDNAGPIAAGIAAIALVLTSSKIIDAVKGIGSAISGVFSLIAANPIGAIIALIAIIVTTLITLWNTNEGFRNAVIGIWTAIVGFFSTVGTAIAGFFSAAWSAIESVWSTVTGFFSGVWSGIQNVFSAIGSWFSDIFSAAVSGIQAAWSGVTGFFSGIWNGIVSVFSVVGSWFSTIFSAAWDGIKTVWSAVTGWFKGVWDGIVLVFSVVGTWFKTIFTTAWTGIQTVWAGVTGFFSGIWNGITGVFSVVGSWFGSVFGTAYDAITTAFSGLTDFFTGIWDGITGAFKSVINFIIRGINTMIRGLNRIHFDFPNWVPGVGGKGFGIHIGEIPELAKGGIVDKATLAMIGEAGKEAIIPLDRNTGWIKELAQELSTVLTGLSDNLSPVHVPQPAYAGASPCGATTNLKYTAVYNSPAAPTPSDVNRVNRQNAQRIALIMRRK